LASPLATEPNTRRLWAPRRPASRRILPQFRAQGVKREHISTVRQKLSRFGPGSTIRFFRRSAFCSSHLDRNRTKLQASVQCYGDPAYHAYGVPLVIHKTAELAGRKHFGQFQNLRFPMCDVIEIAGGAKLQPRLSPKPMSSRLGLCFIELRIGRAGTICPIGPGREIWTSFEGCALKARRCPHSKAYERRVERRGPRCPRIL